jgi:hypothetical protein
LQEEIASLQSEIDAIQETLKHLGCGVGGTAPVQSNQACAQFMVVVQTVTTTSINVPGLSEQSGRSLNNGQGIPVPLELHEDGTFEGFGNGSDSGSAAGATPGEAVRSQFGHMQSVAASGFIRPGSCDTDPCQPDVMHLVLVGGSSEQMTQAQARGAINRDMRQTTPTGAARLEFDLPAYVGGSAQKTFFATGILNSGMTVRLVQADNGTPELPQGSSLLEAQQQCTGGGTSVADTTNDGGAGTVTPGSQGNPSSVELHIDETIHTADAAPVNPGQSLRVDETIHTADAFGSAAPTHVVATVTETIHATDVVAPPAAMSHLVVTVNESVQLNDGMPATGNMPHQIAVIHETVSVTDTPQP